MTSHFPLSGPLTVGDLLDRAFPLYRARFGLFLLTAAIFLVPWAVISVPVSEAFRTYLLGSPAYEAARAVLQVNAGELLFTGLKTLTVTGFVTLALTAQSIETLHSRSLTLGESIRRSLRRFWPYVGMTIAIWAAMFAVAILAMIPFVVWIVALSYLFSDVLENVLAILMSGRTTDFVSGLGMTVLAIGGYALLAILILAPFIYLFARWLVAPAALIAEGLGPLDSLRRSWRLSRGHIRRAMGYVVLLYVIMTLVISFPAALLQQIIFLLRPSGALGLAIGISTVISSLLSIIGTPFYIGAVVLLYYDLRIRGESYDLEMRIAGLEAQAAQDADPESAAPYSDVERVD